MLWIRTFLNELRACKCLVIFVARVAVGLLFFLSGRGKLLVTERHEQMRETLVAAHVPFPSSAPSLFRRLNLSSVYYSFWEQSRLLRA
jgi:uncharacterized membrane protein YphA (DoxX/SURF4 family)